MKKLAVLSMILCFPLFVNGQSNNQVKQSFYSYFGYRPDVKWVQVNNYDEAIFTRDGKEITAYYDSDGVLVGTTNIVPFAKVPMKGQQEIEKKYKDYSIGPVIFFNDNEYNETDIELYGVHVGPDDNYFVELSKGSDKIIVKVDPEGKVSFFTNLR